MDVLAVAPVWARNTSECPKKACAGNGGIVMIDYPCSQMLTVDCYRSGTQATVFIAVVFQLL